MAAAARPGGFVRDARAALAPALLSVCMLALSCLSTEASQAADVEGTWVMSGMAVHVAAAGSVGPGMSPGTSQVSIDVFLGTNQSFTLQADLPSGSQTDVPLGGFGVTLCNTATMVCDDALEGTVTYDFDAPGGSKFVANFTITKSTIFTGRMGFAQAQVEGCGGIGFF